MRGSCLCAGGEAYCCPLHAAPPLCSCHLSHQSVATVLFISTRRRRGTMSRSSSSSLPSAFPSFEVELKVSPEESKRLRALFCRKRPADGDASKEGPAAKRTGACKEEQVATGVVRMLVLDQSIPKKIKDRQAILFGKTAAGQTAALFVSGFTPYFYFPAPRHPQPLTAADMDALRKFLNDKSGGGVLNIAVENHTEAMYYRSSGARPCLCIHVEAQERMKKVSDILSEIASSSEGFAGMQWPAGCEAWETNVSSQLRFFSDLHISGGSWIEVPSRCRQHARSTRCSLELECCFDEVRSLTHDIADSIFPSTRAAGRV